MGNFVKRESQSSSTTNQIPTKMKIVEKSSHNVLGKKQWKDTATSLHTKRIGTSSPLLRELKKIMQCSITKTHEKRPVQTKNRAKSPPRAKKVLKTPSKNRNASCKWSDLWLSCLQTQLNPCCIRISSLPHSPHSPYPVTWKTAQRHLLIRTSIFISEIQQLQSRFPAPQGLDCALFVTFTQSALCTVFTTRIKPWVVSWEYLRYNQDCSVQTHLSGVYLGDVVIIQRSEGVRVNPLSRDLNVTPVLACGGDIMSIIRREEDELLRVCIRFNHYSFPLLN